MNNEIKEILEKLKENISIVSVEEEHLLLDYITNLQQENERLKETNVYCNRTDCVGRIKDSKKYDSVYQEKEDYKSRIEKAVEELELWKPKNKVIQLEIELLLNILRGEDK